MQNPTDTNTPQQKKYLNGYLTFKIKLVIILIQNIIIGNIIIIYLYISSFKIVNHTNFHQMNVLEHSEE